MGWDFQHLYDPAVRRSAGKLQAVSRENIPVVVVNLIAVAVPFCDMLCAVELISSGGGVENTGAGTKPQSTADVHDTILIGHQRNYGVSGIGVQFYAVSARQSGHMPRIFHDGKLHAETEAEIGYPIYSCILDGAEHTVDAPVAKTAGHKDSLHIREKTGCIFRRHSLGIDPFDMHRGTIRDAPVL